MKTVVPILSFFILLTLFALRSSSVAVPAHNINLNAWTTSEEAGTPSAVPTPTPRGWRVVNASQFKGDLAARINAADAALGNEPGEIVVTGNEPINAVVTVGSKHVLKISGTHTLNKGKAYLGLVRLKDSSTLAGDGILRNDKTGLARPRMIETFEGTQRLADRKNPADYDARIGRNITIENLQIKDEPGGNPTAQINAAIVLGNCQDCKVSHVWFNGLNDFGVQVGGHALWPNLWADRVEITDCLFTEVAAQNVAIVQAQNVLVARNRFIKPGRTNQAISVIDAETNYAPYSRLIKITIIDNLIDARESPGSFSGISITSSAASVRVEDINVSGNELLGESSVADAHSRKGIELAGDDLKSPFVKRAVVSNNKVSDFMQICIVAAGVDIQVINNTLTNCGWGAPLSAILVTDLTNSVIKDNRITGNIAQMNFRGQSDRNVIENNTLGQILGLVTNSIFRNNIVSSAQNRGGGIYHSGIRESPGSFGNVYDSNQVTRGDGNLALGLQVQPGSQVRSTIWLEPGSKQ